MDPASIVKDAEWTWFYGQMDRWTDGQMGKLKSVNPTSTSLSGEYNYVELWDVIIHPFPKFYGGLHKPQCKLRHGEVITCSPSMRIPLFFPQANLTTGLANLLVKEAPTVSQLNCTQEPSHFPHISLHWALILNLESRKFKDLRNLTNLLSHWHLDSKSFISRK